MINPTPGDLGRTVRFEMPELHENEFILCSVLAYNLDYVLIEVWGTPTHVKRELLNWYD